MTPSIPETFWLVDWSLVTIIGSTMPPRDPNDDDDDEDEEDERTRTGTMSRQSSENPTRTTNALPRGCTDAW